MRLLGSSLSVNSKDGHGHYFDEILLNTIGLGNDPYESAMPAHPEEQLYRYDMMWRLNDYYNPGLTVAGGLHHIGHQRAACRITTSRCLPQSKFRSASGTAATCRTVRRFRPSQEFDANGSGLPVFIDVRREWNEYRAGRRRGVRRGSSSP